MMIWINSLLCPLIALWAVMMVISAIALRIIVQIQFAQTQKHTIASEKQDVRDEFFKKRFHGKRVLKIGTATTIPLALLMGGLTLANVFMTEDQIRAKITQSTRLVVRTGGNCHRNPEREIVLLETYDPKAMQDLANRFSFDFSNLGSRCMCCGEMTFNLYDGDDLHYSFSFHHQTHIRILGSFTGDRYLTESSIQQLKTWLDEQRITEKLKAFQKQEQQRYELETKEHNMRQKPTTQSAPS